MLPIDIRGQEIGPGDVLLEYDKLKNVLHVGNIEDADGESLFVSFPASGERRDPPRNLALADAILPQELDNRPITNTLVRGQILLRLIGAGTCDVFQVAEETPELSLEVLAVRLARDDAGAWAPSGQPERIDRGKVYPPTIVGGMQRWRFMHPVDPLFDTIADPIGDNLTVGQDALLKIGSVNIPVAAQLRVVDHRASLDLRAHYTLASLVGDILPDHLVDESVSPVDHATPTWEAKVAIGGASTGFNAMGVSGAISPKITHLEVVRGHGRPTVTREVLVGAKFGAWSHMIFRREPPIHPILLTRGLPPDSMRTLFLGQPILIYDPPTHENGDFDYLAVIYVGRPLDDHKHAVLLALVGYLSGGRAVSVLQEQFDSARKLRTAYLDRGQPTIRRSPPIPIDRVTPHSMLMVNEFPRLAEAFNRWKTTESRSFEAVFHHYAEGVDSNYPTTRILRLAVALEAFINLVTGDSSSNEKIIEDDGRFNVIRNHLLNDLSSYRDENTDRLTENELRRLALKITNMNSASNTRRLDKFWSAVPIEKSPDDERLLRRLRNESVHLGYVGEEGTREGLLRNAADADRLTDIFNRAVLAYAGYAGPVRSAHDGSWIEAVSGERFNPPPLPPGDSIELRMDVTVPSMSPSEAEAAERLQRISRSAQRKASE